MAFADRLGGLLSGGNPLFNLGIGLLSASGPSAVPRSLGQVLAQGTQFASQRQLEAAQNEAIRNELKQRARQKQAQQQLVGLLQAPERTPAGQSLPAGNGVLATQDQRQGQLMGLLAQAAPEAAVQGLLSQMFAKPSSFSQKLADVQGALGRPLSNDEVLKLAGGGTTINIGDKLNEPIPITSISSVRLPNGESVPIGTTFDQAKQMGARVLSADEQKKSAQTDSALSVLGQLEEMALGPNGIFANVQSGPGLEGFTNRVGAALDFALQDLTQADPRISRFRDLSEGMIAPFVRLLGESGALATEDVTRALGLLPRTFPLPDTGDVAREKLKDLRAIIGKGVQNMNSHTAPKGPVDVGNGVTVEFLD